ncbi:hypothetical protein [Candidatus Vondammii sp. HM_W22]|uniref:hypothetical protein n=1 Tax=Candidatus Vondammii sp. HM_W22 TaxID=2687299 RepID=UPI002E7BC71C|nr:hypothetical protein [Candidatus Vondammii sp. HM_W22]
MNIALVTEADLMVWMNCKRRADLEKNLRAQGIPVLYGAGGTVCTTINAVNTAMGVGNDDNHSEDIEFV